MKFDIFTGKVISKTKPTGYFTTAEHPKIEAEILTIMTDSTMGYEHAPLPENTITISTPFDLFIVGDYITITLTREDNKK